MNAIKSTIVSLIAAMSSFAESPQFEIEARYEGFDPTLFSEINDHVKNAPPDGIQAAPRVTTKAGNTAIIEIIREVVLPVAPEGEAPDSPRGSKAVPAANARGNTPADGRKTVNCGVSLEVCPQLKDGNITLTGKTTVRHRLNPGAIQPLNAVSFTTRETFFADQVTDGKSIVIRVGDGPVDKSQITLTVKKIAAK